ncbi:MAG TPA: ABC transporter permease [Verrucomicrobiae bacterium]|jgi:peptide/nickel transport system permease protein|nr:ABC transporter permease [Verrucomicrobiae bacterium]
MLARYVVRRVLQLIPVLILVSLAVFLLVRVIPGDPVLVMLGIDPDERARISAEQYRALQHQIGLDQPIYVQYLNWANNIVHGDFGLSLASRRPITEIIFERYPATLYLAAIALFVGIAIAIPAGAIAATRQNTKVDYAAMGFALWGVAMPDFWLALMLMVLFSLKLGWLPSIGYASPFEHPWLFLQHACLPAIVMGTELAAPLTRYVRAEMLDQLKQDYVRTAWAKGLPSRMVIVKHALRNSLIAAVTVVGLQTARLLGGATIIETVFSWPGVGRLLIDGIYQRDYPIVQGAVLLIAVTYVFINLIVDIFYKWLDPRIKLE